MFTGILDQVADQVFDWIQCVVVTWQLPVTCGYAEVFGGRHLSLTVAPISNLSPSTHYNGYYYHGGQQRRAYR